MPGLPKDAIVVTRPGGSTLADPDSTTGKLMAPPRADFKAAYAAGKAIASRWPWDQYSPGLAALGHFGTYDYQRDRATNTFYDAYTNAANYAVGVYIPAVLFVLLLPAGCDEDMANDASVANARGDTALLHIGACTGVGTFVEYSIALRLHGESKDRRHSHRLRFFFEGDYAPPSSPSTRDN